MKASLHRDVVPMAERHFIVKRGETYKCIACQREHMTAAEAAQRCDKRAEREKEDRDAVWKA